MTSTSEIFQESSASKNSAFTLLELLVAMTVLSLLVLMLMGIVDSATKLWRENENRVESYREARAAMNLIASDLRSLHASTNSNYFRLEADSGTNDGSLAFLASLPNAAQDSTNRSDLCSVGYFLAEGPVSDFAQQGATPETSYNLYRYFIESNETFDRLESSPADPGFWPDEFAVDSDPRPEILARNIRAFRIKAFRIEGNTWVVWTHSDEHPIPDLLELEMEAVNSQIRARLSGDLKADVLDPPNPEVRVLSTRIPLRQPFQP